MSNQQEEKVPDSIIWLHIDFETVKHRIDKITDKINRVLLTFNDRGDTDLSNQDKPHTRYAQGKDENTSSLTPDP